MLTLTKFSNNIFNPYFKFILESQTCLRILRTFINYFSPTLRCTENYFIERASNLPENSVRLFFTRTSFSFTLPPK